MVIGEVFPNPTVKQVVFQITFPHLFYMEQKIGELQVKIMRMFPKSSLLYRRQFVFMDTGPKAKTEDISKKLDEEYSRKVWQFEADKKYKLSVLTSSLDIVSEHHKTYNNLDEPDRFRDIIESVLEHFFEVAPIPMVNRVGLRYIDECPLPSKDNKTFRLYYNSAFPLKRFNMAKTSEIFFRTVTRRGKFNLIYQEYLQKLKEGYRLILDFDGFATKIRSQNCLRVTDELHKIISKEYEKTIKEPVYEYMRQERTPDV